MTSTLCTVVIPAYNAGPWLGRTLRSAAQQSHANLEILIIDDGSTDNTRAVSEAMATADSRFRIISIPNGGVANARNIGIREARGEFIAFLDADDLWHPQKIAAQLELMNMPIDGVLPGACYTLMRWIDVDDRATGFGELLGPSGFILARHLYFKPVGNGSSVLVRREIALASGGYDPSWAAQGIGGCEDLDFELKISAKHPFVCVPRLMVGYRKSPGNMSSHRKKMAGSLFGVIERHIQANPQLPEWAIRDVYGSTLEYTSHLLLDGFYVRLAIQHLRRLFNCDPRRAVMFAFWMLLKHQPERVLRVLRRKLLTERRWLGHVSAASTTVKTTYADLDPELIPARNEPGSSRRERAVLSALEALDAKLWAELRSRSEESVQA